MKCKSCDIDVPPAFARALIDNKCPSCGSVIMSGAHMKGLLTFKKNLDGLGLDEKTTVMISAALFLKFDLVPKNERAERAQEPVVNDVKAEPKTEEEILREKAFLAAQKAKDDEVAKEWGLEHGEMSKAILHKQLKGAAASEDDYGSIFDAPQDSFDDIPLPLPPAPSSSSAEADRMARLARAQAARNSELPRVNRIS